MTIRISRVFLLIFFMLIVNNYAYWEWTPKTRSWVNPKYAVKGNPEEQFQWAEELRNEGYLEKSISEHKKLIKHFPNSEYAPESHFVLGKIYKENNDIKRAFNYFEKILDKYPASPRTIEVINMIMDTGEQKLSRPSRKVLRFLKDDKSF